MNGPDTVEDWRGASVGIARSPSGVLLLRDYADNLIRVADTPWPPPGLVAKLVADDHIARAGPKRCARRSPSGWGTTRRCSRSTARTRSPGRSLGR